MTESTIRTTSKLYDYRDTMRRLHGEEWPDKIKQLEPIIRGVAKQENIDLLPAAINIAHQAQADHQPMAAIMILAVACELIEPAITTTQPVPA